jgi:hypothetical protein
LPSLRASKRRERCSSFANVISTFHFPIMFGDCASAKTEQHVFNISVRINGRGAFTFFCNPNLVGEQGREILTEDHADAPRAKSTRPT